MNPRFILAAMLLIGAGGGVLHAQTEPDHPELLRIAGPAQPQQPQAARAGQGQTDAQSESPAPEQQPPQDIPPAREIKPEPIEPSREAHLDTAEFRSERIPREALPIATHAVK